MITIMCGQDQNNDINIDANATININDEATVTEIFYSIVKAMIYQGYYMGSIDKNIKEIASAIDTDYNTYDILCDMIFE